MKAFHLTKRRKKKSHERQMRETHRWLLRSVYVKAVCGKTEQIVSFMKSGTERDWLTVFPCLLWIMGIFTVLYFSQFDLVSINHTQSFSLFRYRRNIIKYFFRTFITPSVYLKPHVGKTWEERNVIMRCSTGILDKSYLRSGRWCVLLNMFVGQHTWEYILSDQCEQMSLDHLCVCVCVCVWTEGLNVSMH